MSDAEITLDQYRETVLEIRTAYGSPGDSPLTPDEEEIVRHAWEAYLSAGRAARYVLKARGEWPEEPDPRRTYPRHKPLGITSVHASDRFGRTSPGGRRR